MSDASVYPAPRVQPAGDQAVLVEIGEGIDEAVNRRVHALALELEQRRIAGVVDLVPTYRSLLVNYDPLRLPYDRLAAAIAEAARALDVTRLPAPNRVEIPTCYGGSFGPDLAFVARHNGRSEDEVVAIHTAGTYRVFMMGFSPGFAYLGGMSSSIAAPRLKTPRTAIPAGSVGIAQNQTGIYPVESPGGWQLIGRTPVRLFDPTHTPPTLVGPGDEISFVKIDEKRYRDLEATSHPAPPASPVADLAAEGAHDARLSPAVEVLEAGLLTPVQDLGRYGWQRYGVPVSGAMDCFAARVANLLVGNDERAAALEITLAGPQLLLLDDLVLAVTGADLQPRVDDTAAPTWQAFAAPKGAVLSFRGRRAGARAYLAVAGGLAVPVVLGSRSTYLRSRLGGVEGRPLQPGDRLLHQQGPASIAARQLPRSWLPTYLGSHRVRVVLGPQDDMFTARGIDTLLASAYMVGAQSDRMGFRLEGPPIEHRTTADIISDGTPAGAVQVAGDGQPLVLLADRGTTGGYAKIATVVSVDLARLAQCRPGDRVFFDAVTVEEAHEALRRQDALFTELRSSESGLLPTVFSRAAAPGDGHRIHPAKPDGGGPASVVVRAPLPGKIVHVAVREGDVVERGQPLCALEAMKMQNALVASHAGRVTAVRVAAGDQVAHGQALVEIETAT